MALATLVLTFTPAVMAADIPLAQLKTITPQALPDLQFQDDHGNKTPFKPTGTPLMAVHFWATWCVPCVAELPQVDVALKKYADKGFKVTAISLDTNMDKVKKFFTEHQIKNLTANLDVNTASFQAMKAEGLPATIFYNAEGKAIARADGPLDWSSESVKNFIESQLKK